MQLLDAQANIKTNNHVTKSCIGFLFHRFILFHFQKVCGSEICFLQKFASNHSAFSRKKALLPDM